MNWKWTIKPLDGPKIKQVVTFGISYSNNISASEIDSKISKSGNSFFSVDWLPRLILFSIVKPNDNFVVKFFIFISFCFACQVFSNETL